MSAATSFAGPARAVPLRVSDVERERTAGLLREHWLAGRLTLAELEARSAEAWSARYVADLWSAVRELPVPMPPVPAAPVAPPRRLAQPVWSLILSITGASALLLSFGLLFLFTIPLTAAGWALGRGVRRDPTATAGRSLAGAGEVVGAVATVCACLVLAACSAVVAGG